MHKSSAMTWCKSRKLQCPQLQEQKREIIARLTAAVTYLGETFPANEAILFRHSARVERAVAATSPSWVQAEGRQGREKQPRKPPPWSQPHHFAAYWSSVFLSWL